ncbi:MAG: hypothetical protein DSM106950_03655 [Stigonema ocellatum SAG 48.90 = DSM 106950]|nr:hypothetical protein [Stigonema ocellatum SAG 48.90 = DSM 106950]
MKNVSELAIHYLNHYNCHINEGYTKLLFEACEINPPPHGKAWYGNLYRQHARKSEWFANSLIANAYEEGNGARQVWQFSRCVENQDFARLIRSHSIDESRHSKMFTTLFSMLFPMKLEEEVQAQLKAFSPMYSKENHPPTVPVSADDVMDELLVMDELIQINLLEIRALILQLLLRPVLQAYAKPEDREKVSRMSDQFIFDETKHIEYSAYCIGEYIKWGDCDWLRQTMIDRQATVNQMFLEDIDHQDSIGTTILRTQDAKTL